MTLAGTRPILQDELRQYELHHRARIAIKLELLYIDDLVEGMFDLLENKEQHCEFNGVETVLKDDGRYCCVPVTHKVTLGEIVDLQSHLMSRLLPMIGRNSIWILCIHTIEFDVFPWWILARICTMAKIGGLYETAQAILRIVMAICISMIAEKMRDMDHATTNLKNI